MRRAGNCKITILPVDTGHEDAGHSCNDDSQSHECKDARTRASEVLVVGSMAECEAERKGCPSQLPRVLGGSRLKSLRTEVETSNGEDEMSR